MILLMPICNLPQTGTPTTYTSSAVVYSSSVFSADYHAAFHCRHEVLKLCCCWGIAAACSTPAQISSILIPTLTFVAGEALCHRTPSSRRVKREVLLVSLQCQGVPPAPGYQHWLTDLQKVLASCGFHLQGVLVVQRLWPFFLSSKNQQYFILSWQCVH